MAKVYYMDDRASSYQTSLVAKMLTLFDAAKFGSMIKRGDLVAIKLHMGEFNNTGYLRPVYVRAMADKVKSLGGDPMVIDTTTLPYSAFPSRATAVDYLNTAYRNGFTPSAVGCPVVIADGFIGTDDIRIDLPEGYILKEQYIATGCALADSMIVLTHFKGHPQGTFGGAVKNIGVGCASKRGKLNLHMGGHSIYGFAERLWFPQRCAGKSCPTWEVCDNLCPVQSYRVTDSGIEWKKELCVGCGACFGPMATCGALFPPLGWLEATATALVDSALAAVKAIGKGKMGFINLAVDISPFCDCVNFTDRSIVPNLGLFASWDPVSVDAACVQKAKESSGMPGSLAMAKGAMNPGIPKFSTCGSVLGVSEEIQLNVGVKIGLGERKFEIEEVPAQEDPTPFLFNPIPGGARLARRWAKKPEIQPEGGFKRVDKVDFSELK